MKIKVKKSNRDGIVRLETQGNIKEIMINENFMKPNEESISICFRGKNTSGIVDFSPEEFEKFFMNINDKIHLIKGFKKFKEK